ncbi:hypothetical protein SNE25_18290 [Mucilaginibacter sabulilitoris]|uniref:Uncharacterized protein n=1 Tax=Mucilaginibacter sabulilitoris TaxID=1173583 RepID=A0ABZ0TET6_9SPHI|nr:hypothetical protein [Mucilaginibacter sabulilitoris]WPU91269.1 hypothetical protein SNE25_18290 [Mucilaginibacter sabulilitoris]
MELIDLVLYAIGILISIFLARAIFSIPTIVDQLKQQTKLLEQIASKNSPPKKEKPLISDSDLEKEALSHPKE